MKKKLLIAVVFIFCHHLFSQELKLTGKVVDETGIVMPGADITNLTTNKKVSTDFEGIFTMTYTKDSELLRIQFIGFITKEVSVKYFLENKEIVLEADDAHMAELVVASYGTLAPSNYWVGAKVGYNFVSDTDEDNFIGSAIVSLNMLESESKRRSFSVIGNIGDFKFTKDTAEVAKIGKLAQSLNGISIGLGYEYNRNGFFGCDIGLEKFYSKVFVSSLARFTTYKNIGTDNHTENFVQNVNTVGTEFALDGFKEGGQLTLTLCSSLMLFDPNKYELIFEEKKDYLVTYEATLIIPIQKKIGFFLSGTFSDKSSALFSFGIALK
ncbi:carboxypeptidase-like regulatory domain-containing protein [Flavobacterium sp.]|uniref:carboxypeptidase-like regulatory domain-containing protein n=1 Tax=Flavobacterium sp. TaxID=239 RepID=UPI003D0CB815